jgi:hypothetical protein
VSIEQKDEIVIPAFTGSVNFKYVRTSKEGE